MDVRNRDAFLVLMIFYCCKVSGNLPISWNYNTDRAGIRFEKSRIGLLINCLLLGGMIVRVVDQSASVIQLVNKPAIIFTILQLVHDITVIITLGISLMFRRTRLLALLNSMYNFLMKNSPQMIISLGYASYASLVFPIISILQSLKGYDPVGGVNYFLIYTSFLVHICPDLFYSLFALLSSSYIRQEINGPLTALSSLPPGRSTRELLFLAKKRHFRLMNCTACLHSCFSFDLLNSMFYCLVRLLFYVYVSWKYTKFMMNAKSILNLCVQIILTPLRLLYVCYCSHSITLEVERTIDILTDFYVEKCEEMTGNVEEIVEVFLSQLSSRKGVFSPFGLFNVDLPFFCSYIGAVITYTVIIMQFL